MVSKVLAPVLSHEEVFERVFEERVRYKAFYNRIRDDWWRAVTIYVEHGGDPSVACPLRLIKYTESQSEEEARDRKKSLINLYSPPEEHWLHDVLYKMRREHGLTFCPSCGESGTPKTLDHYLPKTEFPEFSVLLQNLTPMCYSCQEEKGTKWATAVGGKKFLHPYYDDFDFPLLEIKFFKPFVSPAFCVGVHSSVPASLKSLISGHIDGVGIDKRLKEFCGEKYMQLLRSARKHRDKSQVMSFVDKVEIFLENEECKSVNCWEAVFYRSVLADFELLHFLENEDLPAYL